MLRCKNVSADNILDNISFEVRRGTFCAILGKNGSGKTTLARCIMSERKFDGKITLGGVSLCDISPRERAKKIAYLPQSLPLPNITVRELVSLGRNPHTSLGGKLGEKDKTALEKALAATEMLEFAERMLPTLSGGEKKRAYLAMTLAQDADILLLDEPTAYMDMSAAAEFAALLSRLDKTLIVIMHDLSLAAKYADDVLILHGGKQVFFGSKKECLGRCEIEKAFGVRRIEKDNDIVFLV